MSVGLLLAAGAGRRMGGPKALVSCADEIPWVTLAIDALREGGCDDVVVCVGASAEKVTPLVIQAGAHPLLVPDWADGMGRTLTAGLEHIADSAHESALIHLVDLLDVTAQVVERVASKADATTVARATFGHRAGHPVLIGRSHWPDLRRHLASGHAANQGARGYLQRQHVVAVDCADLASGIDMDTAYQACPRCGVKSHIVRR